MSECYNITLHLFITIIRRIMLQKNTLLFAALSIAFSGAAVQHADAAVVASLKPLGFIASAITDGVTDTQVLLPDGASEHDYSLRPSDVKRLQNADLVVWIGPEMEAFMNKSTQSISDKNKVTIAQLDGVKPLLMKGGDDDDHDHEGDHDHAGHESEKGDAHHHHGDYNMHLWLSPEIARLSAVAIHDKLVELMPQSRAKLDANLKDFEAQLATADKEVGNELAPLKGKGYFVFHDAYGYYEKQYGLTPLGHFTVNPEIQPGAQRLHQIRTQLVEQKATCVFAEPQFRPAVVEAVARGTSVRMGTLDPLGTNIQLSKESYATFLRQLANQYSSCLKGD
ncbi:High-affinity zinc uptake system protein ZnuA [Pseudocitrobacter vendiensis]|uniref:High-affinity zinc uptake system protein ZnuA n=2 Tax=Pseudocitrobacter vendiensis TaxID=2488306 RepID=A0ABN8TD71_9ENTR|nr:High-affinity zinc uptake system protein ZnuA [Pseudocitrobacter vendiensis]